jgi:hypothetical protein
VKATLPGFEQVCIASNFNFRAISSQLTRISGQETTFKLDPIKNSPSKIKSTLFKDVFEIWNRPMMMGGALTSTKSGPSVIPAAATVDVQPS